MIEKSDEISATRLVYSELVSDTKYDSDLIEYLLKFQNPLEVVRDAWMDSFGFSLEDEVSCVLGNIAVPLTICVKYCWKKKYANTMIL